MALTTNGINRDDDVTHVGSILVPTAFDIRAADMPLIEAAIRFGDWIAARPETTREQREAVATIQAALRRLPEAVPCLSAAYGLSLHPPYNRPEGVWRYWGVDLSAGRAGGPASLSIGSIWTPEPRAADIRDEIEMEFEWEIKAGQSNLSDDYRLAEFIAEISDPETLLSDGLIPEIEAEVRLGTA